MSEREQYIILKKSFSVNVLPEFSEAIASSKSVSGTQVFAQTL